MRKNTDSAFIDDLLKSMSLERRFRVNTQMNLITAITELGYREDKMWSDDDDDTLNKILDLANSESKYLYEDVIEWINDGKPGYKEKVCLFLDDMRNPFIDFEGKVPKTNAKIVWVRDYQEFVEWINLNGFPDIISFDHDLADEHYTPEEYWEPYDVSKAYQEKAALEYKEKTGMDCAKWLVDKCMDNNLVLPEFYVHSANPVGGDNIRFYLENYLKSL